MLSKNQAKARAYDRRQMERHSPVGGSVIIQCPKCQTKFAVNTELISELDLPRFHCSRCDHVFDMSNPSVATDDEVAINTSKLSISPAFTEPSPSPSSATYVEEPNPIDDASEPVTQSRSKESSLLDNPVDLLSPAYSSSSTRAVQNSSSLQIPKEIDPDLHSTAPHDTSSAHQYEQMNIAFIQAEPSSDTFGDDTHYALPETKAPLAESEFEPKPGEKFNFGDPQSPDVATFDFGAGAITSNKINLATSRGANPNGMMIFVMPVLFCMVVLSALSYLISSSPTMVEALTRSIPNSLPRFAPAGMRLERLKFSKIALESGDIVHIISGKIRNDSQENFSEVTVEGLVFDSRGKLLDTMKIDAASSLADARMRSLPLDMIKNLQTSKSNKKYQLKAGDSEDFTIALVGTGSSVVDLTQASYFYARIYSVR